MAAPLTAFRKQVVQALSAADDLAGVQILRHPPGENENQRECIYFEGSSTEWEWRSLGVGSHLLKNRTSTLNLTLKVRVSAERPDHRDAADAALERCEELVGFIEVAIAEAPDVPGDETASVSFALLRGAELEPVPLASGWGTEATLVIEGQYFPA